MIDDIVKQKIDDILDNIPPSYSKEDPEYELKIFTYIYVKLSMMLTYSYRAAEVIEANLGGYDREMAYDYCVIPASTIECLNKGKALCTGYAATLSFLLDKVGIENMVIQAKGVHAWNQVCLNGEWYNCDLTNDSDFIQEGLECPHFLKSNADDSNFAKRPPTTKHKLCQKSISSSKQEELLSEAKMYLESLKKQSIEAECDSYTGKRPKFIQWISKKIKSIGEKTR